MLQGHFLSSSRIQSVLFSLNGSDDIKNGSFVEIITHEPFRNYLPYPKGVYAAHLGSTDHAYKCMTCLNKKPYCLGHPGHITLNYPVWNPIPVAEGRKWLKLICFKCGQPIIKDSKFARIPASKRLDEASKIARSNNAKNSNKTCVRCGEPHPVIKKDKKEPLVVIAEYYDEKYAVQRITLLPHVIEGILSRVTDETVIKLGKSIRSHPRNIILRYIEVPPVTIRPDVRKAGGNRSTSDDLTTMLQVIIKKNETMPTVIPDTIDAKLEKSIVEFNNTFYDFVRAKGENSVTSLTKRLKGKGGRFRKNQLGKRVRSMARSTITGLPRIMIDEVGIPITFAKTIQFREHVQEYNRKRLLGYVLNGPQGYPGASRVIKKSGVEIGIVSGIDIDLENGDIVLRDLIDGDPVNFNRQPSLAISNISTHRAKIIRDDSNKTLVMNVIACALYNADFDGDQMNLIINTGVAARNEITELSSVSNWFISHTTSSPTMGQVDDSIVGLAELSRSRVRFNKYHALLLFNDTTMLPSFEDAGDTITGRECISKLLESTPVNFTRGTSWYKPDMAAYMKYDPSEITVEIHRGKLTRGILDKASIGKGANGGLYHIVANEYGADTALELIFNMQQVAIGYILQYGFTIGIMDLLISDRAKAEVDMIAMDIISKSKLVTEELNNGEIIPPIGKTVEQFFEERQIKTLSIFDDFNEPILKDINPDANNLFKMVMFECKGKREHMINMVSAVGQKLINGERIRQKFGFKRTLPYFPRFDTSPEARGYIANGYLAGMTSSEYVFNAMASRFDLIAKALNTSVTGEQNRKSIKNLESIIINNLRMSMKHKNVIQMIYGEDMLDPRFVEKVKFPTVMISDEAFTGYTHPDYPEFHSAMNEDRKQYREVFLRVERMNIKELMSDVRQMPFNLPRIITDVCAGYADALVEPTPEDLKKMVGMVDELCDLIPYTLINEIQRDARGFIPPQYRAASWLSRMLLRSYLHPRALVDRKLTPATLQMILDKCVIGYWRALIEPGTAAGIISAQSFSEPLTQYMLDAHHRSASGGTSKSSMTTCREVLGAKPESKLTAPSMRITVKPEYAGDQSRVQEIANNIEVMYFRQFVTSWQIFFEKFGEPVHPKYAEERPMFTEFAKANPLLKPPGDLIKWCIRFALNKTTLILKNMSLDLIVTKLRESSDDIYVVNTSENSTRVIIRVYMRNTMFRGNITTNVITGITEGLLDRVIRGVDGISNVAVVKSIRNKTNPDGSIDLDTSSWTIVTDGTNITDMMTDPHVDPYQLQTDAILEMARVFGIEAARQKLISAFRDIVGCNHRHYLIYVDEMTYTGKVTSIESSGLKTRESSNVLLRVGFSHPVSALEEASANAMKDSINGVTSELLIGGIPHHGTIYNKFYINEEFVRENVKRPDDLLAELID